MSRSASFVAAIEEHLAGWTLPLGALAVAAAAWALDAAGALGEERAGEVIVAAIAVAGAALVLRPAVRAGADPLGRSLALGAALATLALAALPALATISPGAPLAEGDLAAAGASLPLPAGATGAVRLLVRTRLPQGGMPRVAYRITGTTAPAQGQLERTASSARVGRGTRTTVTRDHAAQYVSATLGEGSTVLRLDRLSGETAAPLHVAVYPERLPAPWLLALAAATVVLAAIADARLGVKDQGAAGAGIALAFGILVTRSATPQGAVGEAFASLAVALFAGGLTGWIAGLVARRVVPAPRRERRGGAGA